MVENWWSILYEPPSSPQVFEGTRFSQRDDTKRRSFLDWMRRHNLVFSREGMELPDMTIFRDEDRIPVPFAAELLAPAAAIQQALDEEREIKSIADQFGVSEFVVLHQIENHRLSTPE